MKSRTVLTPARTKGRAIELSALRFRKQVLPLTSIKYKGKRITFDKQYLTDLANSFTDGAFDQVPFVLADAHNQHNESPDNFRGEVKGFELTDDGLDAIFEFPDEASASVVRKNPKLGVSARILEGHTRRSDGKVFSRAIRHVLGTMDPYVNGMKPWTEIALSGYTPKGKVLDLTSASYEETKMAKSDKKSKKGLDLSNATIDDTTELTDDEIQQILLEAANDLGDDGADTDLDIEYEDGTPDDDPAPGKTGAPVSKTKEVQLSADDRASIDLANSRAEQAEARAFAAQVELVQTRWVSERAGLANKGVPPKMLDLAAPVLSQVDPMVLDLSNGDDETLDVSEVIRDMLAAAEGMVDLSSEAGYSAEPDEERDADAEALENWPGV